MTEIAPRKAEQLVDEFIARLSSVSTQSADGGAAAHEAALKRLMAHLIEREGWLAEEFSLLARRLGAY